IVVAGVTTPRGPINNDLLLLRCNPDGTLDRSFSGDGFVALRFHRSDEAAEAVALAPLGKILVAGSYRRGRNGFGLLARFKGDGSLDPNFGLYERLLVPGVVVTDFVRRYNDGFVDLTLLPDGKIVAGGTADIGSTDSDFALARYTGSPVS